MQLKLKDLTIFNFKKRHFYWLKEEEAEGTDLIHKKSLNPHLPTETQNCKKCFSIIFFVGDTCKWQFSVLKKCHYGKQILTRRVHI